MEILNRSINWSRDLPMTIIVILLYFLNFDLIVPNRRNSIDTATAAEFLNVTIVTEKIGIYRFFYWKSIYQNLTDSELLGLCEFKMNWFGID